jgi:hypothetical protein
VVTVASGDGLAGRRPRALAAVATPAFATLAVLLGACAPGPVLRYASDDPADRWQAGVRLHAARAERALFLTAFAGETVGEVPGHDGRALTFSLLARNPSDSILRLDPGDFRLLVPRTGKAYAPVDPESVLAALDRDRRDEIHLASAQRDFRGILAVPLLAADIASLGADARTRGETARVRAEAERAEAEENALHREALDGLDAVRRRWSEEALRRTDLDAGKGTTGDLTFPFPGFPLPPDTVVMQWRAPDGRFRDLGRYGRPRLPADTAAPDRPYRLRASSVSQAP